MGGKGLLKTFRRFNASLKVMMHVSRLPHLQKHEETLNKTNGVLGLETRTRS